MSEGDQNTVIGGVKTIANAFSGADRIQATLRAQS